MSTFLEKSNQSLNSAQILVKNNFYPSTVNRAYYGCIQYLLHILFEKLQYDKVKFYQDVRTQKDGTHGWASKLIEIEMAKKPDKSDYKWFQVKIKEFKKERVAADYYIDIVGQERGVNSINTAKTIINVINKNFK